MRPHLRIAVSALVIALAAATCGAQVPLQPQPPTTPQPPAARVVVPVFTQEPIPGVNGSSWTTDFSLSNQGTNQVTVEGVAWDCLLPECGFIPAPVDPGRTFQPHLTDDAGALHGQILYVDAFRADDISFGLRFRDLSRQGATWGTEIPVPREADFHTKPFSLVDVPVEDGFRQTLRIYSIQRFLSTDSAIVYVYRLDPDRDQPNGDADELLGIATLPITYPAPSPNAQYHPGYAEVTDLSTLAPLGDAQRLRIVVQPDTPALKLWAFVTVIHNDTQHATVITPQTRQTF